MLQHHETLPKTPPRVVILGAKGFVGHATATLLATNGIQTLLVGRPEVDLLANDAMDRLTMLLHPGDTLVVVSAKAPCRDFVMLEENIRMMTSVCSTLGQRQVAHVIYISSDAVYRDSDKPLTEASCAEPNSLHGVMHLARELMLKSAVKVPLAILRPSLLYGANDPHNGYGPNRFRRLANGGQDIVLFGDGEERRDHVFIDDVAELIRQVILHRSSGILNVATGEVHSFRAIAENIVAMENKSVCVRVTPRNGPMPHHGYRPFDISICRKSFPNFAYTSLIDGLTKAKQDNR